MYGRRPTATISLSKSICLLAGLVLIGDRHRFAFHRRTGDAGAEPDVQTLRFEYLLRVPRDARVDHRQEVVQRFENHDLRAEAAPDAAEFEPDDAGADDAELLRHGIELERAGRVDDETVGSAASARCRSAPSRARVSRVALPAPARVTAVRLSTPLYVPQAISRCPASHRRRCPETASRRRRSTSQRRRSCAPSSASTSISTSLGLDPESRASMSRASTYL